MIKRVIILGLLALLGCLVIAAPVAAAGFGVSPSKINLEVPANGSAEAVFYISGYSGDIQIGLEGIPLTVEPEKVRIRRSDSAKEVVLTFYGNESLGEQTFEGKITFLATGEGNVGFGIKVKAVITQMAPALEETPPPEEASTPAEQAPPEEAPLEESPPTGESEQSSPTLSESSSFPVLPVAGIAAGTIIIITLIVVIARRYQY
ncbi:hypothetical protein ES703_108346 [subsurface metagenome]